MISMNLSSRIVFKSIVIGMCICLPLSIGFGIIHKHILLGIFFGNITGIILGIIIGKFNENKDRQRE